jgi:lantibiotic biosynthesis protein
MSSDGSLFRDVAARLADEVASSAIWFDDRCNWVGAVGGDRSPMSGRAVLAALGPDLYGGTSGVALFLAEASAMFDDSRLKATALGAIRLALDHADRVDAQARDGLYNGHIGIAYSAIRVAGLLGAQDVEARALSLLEAWWRRGSRSPASDLMSGVAGSVLGLVALGGLRPWLLDAAARLGDELSARADSTGHGWSWMAPGPRSMHNPCGYAHGAAGIGHALAELSAATGEQRFGEAALRAFDYERSWLDTATGTWPDLRAVARRAGRDAPVPTSGSWCNGAAGIALSRLRAAELLASPALARDAEIALATSERWGADLLAQAPEDFSLCHGAAGAADVLFSAGDRCEDLAFALGRHGIELYVDSETTRFPSGLPVGETTGMMLGSSGIGMLYLRLFESHVDSPLCVRLTARARAA